MHSHQIDIARGLRPWSPEQDQTIKRPGNIAALGELSTQLTTVQIEVDDINVVRCVTQDRVAYESVTPKAVSVQEDLIKASKGPVFSCLSLEGPISRSDERFEEARIRALHNGLGRSVLRFASTCEDEATFMDATHDFITIFKALKLPTHEFILFNAAKNTTSMTYLYKRKAVQHRSVRPELAQEFVSVLAAGIKNGSHWLRDGAPELLKSIQFTEEEYGRVGRKRSKAERPIEAALEQASPATKYNLDHTRALIFHERSASEISHLERFINQLTPHARETLVVRLEIAHNRYVRERHQMPQFSEKNALKVAYSGVLACMDAQPESVLAASVAKSLRKAHSRNYMPLIVLGNLVTDRANTQSVYVDGPRPLPGAAVTNVPKGFKNIRDAITAERQEPESKQLKMLNDVVHTYLRTVCRD